MTDLTKKPYNLSSAEIDFVKNKVANMPLSAKIGQLFFVIGEDEDNTDLTEFVKKYQPGGIMYRPDKAQKLQHEIAVSQKERKSLVNSFWSEQDTIKGKVNNKIGHLIFNAL
ncbi:MAG: hypothetical protein M3Z87_11090, partial [Lactobacillus sp.]|nr:hypothetical protein [Lactobacillus sp.]